MICRPKPQQARHTHTHKHGMLPTYLRGLTASGKEGGGDLAPGGHTRWDRDLDNAPARRAARPEQSRGLRTDGGRELVSNQPLLVGTAVQLAG